MRIFRQLLFTALSPLALLCVIPQATKASTITFELPATYTTVNSYTELGVGQAGGQAGFSLNSVDLSPAFMIFSGTAAVTSLWVATLRGKSSRSVSFSLQTFTPPLTNLASVPFGSQGAPSSTFQDNGVIDTLTGIGLPEPTTMLLLGTGLAGVAAKVARRRRTM